ncbi:MAG: hypothetical protein ACTTJ7_00700 [Treponema sp.]
MLRTITNAINNIEKTHVCSAADHIAIFSNNSAYSCYNLLPAEYKICDDLSVIDMNALDEKLKEHKEKPLINKFPKEYYKIKFFVDYWQKNFSYNELFNKNQLLNNLYERYKIKVLPDDIIFIYDSNFSPSFFAPIVLVRGYGNFDLSLNRCTLLKI